jgi:hypothetical protein
MERQAGGAKVRGPSQPRWFRVGQRGNRIAGLMRRGGNVVWCSTCTAAPVGTFVEGAATATPVNTAYVIAVMTSLNCGVDVLCLRAVEPNSTGEHAQTYPTLDLCIAARDRLLAQRDATDQLALRCVPEDSALPYDPKRSDLFKVH